RPRLILADEPTGSLDAENERAVLDLFAQMHAAGQTIVMVTHDLVGGRRAGRQIQLEHGRVAGEFLTHEQDEEAIDEVREYLWLRTEGDPAAHEICAIGARLATPQLLERMRARGILGSGAVLEFSEPGRRRRESL